MVHRIQAIDYHQTRLYSLVGQQALAYNSYYINDTYPCIIQLPPPVFMHLFISKINSIVGDNSLCSVILTRIDPIIIQSLTILLNAYPNISIFVNRKSFETISTFKPEYFDLSINIVDSHYQLNTGNFILCFKQTPLLRWPDSMVVYCTEQQLLFSGDIFSQYSADSTDDYNIIYDNQLYFVSNLFTHVPNQLKTYLNWLEDLKLSYILPDFGQFIQTDENIKKSLQLYYRFTGQIQNKPKFIALYETMYGTTEKAVDLVAKVLKSHDIDVVMLNMKYNQLDKLALHAQDSVGIILATPTLNGDAMPGVIDGVSFLKQLGIMKGKIGFVLGAYGWDGGMAQRRLQKDLEEMNVQVLGKIVWKYNFGEEIYAQLTEAGEVVTKKVYEMINKKNEQ